MNGATSNMLEKQKREVMFHSVVVACLIVFVVGVVHRDWLQQGSNAAAL
jgi:hypothetical protein